MSSFPAVRTTRRPSGSCRDRVDVALAQPLEVVLSRCGRSAGSLRMVVTARPQHRAPDSVSAEAHCSSSRIRSGSEIAGQAEEHLRLSRWLKLVRAISLTPGAQGHPKDGCRAPRYVHADHLVALKQILAQRPMAVDSRQLIISAALRWSVCTRTGNVRCAVRVFTRCPPSCRCASCSFITFRHPAHNPVGSGESRMRAFAGSRTLPSRTVRCSPCAPAAFHTRSRPVPP